MEDWKEWQEYVAIAEGIQVELEELPSEAEDFACDIDDRLEDMINWMTEHKRVTSRMKESIMNIQRGVQKWL